MARNRDSLRRRHHTVSKFYLAGFADDAGQLTQVHLPGRHAHPNSVNNASVETDFYSFRMPDGSLDDRLERAFGDIESLAAQVLQTRVEERWPLDDAEKAALAAWVALQYVRSPSLRTMQTQLYAQTIRMVVLMAGRDRLREMIEAYEGTPVSEERLGWEWNDLTKPEGPHLEPDVVFHARTISETLQWLMPVVHRCQWMLVVFDRRSLITCDHPVSLVAPRDVDGLRGVGLATADAYVLPLSRRIGLVVMPHERGRDLRTAGTTALWKVFIDHALGNARKYLFHHPDDIIPDGWEVPPPRGVELAPIDSSLFEPRIPWEEIEWTDEEREARRRMTSLMEPSGPTLSADDLMWPIPG
jgi:hypothetical protein